MSAPIQFRIVVAKEDLLTANQRIHWRKRAERTKALRSNAKLTALNTKAHLEAAHCLVEIAWPTRHRRDAHNLMPTIKACIDGIVDAGVLPDDDDTHMTGPDLRVVDKPDWQFNTQREAIDPLGGPKLTLRFTFTSTGDAA